MAGDSTMRRQARQRQRAFQGGTVISAGGHGHMPTGQSRQIKVSPRGVYKGSRSVARGSRKAAGGTWSAAQSVTTRGKPGTSHLLAAELLAAAVIVGIRVVGDYEVNEEGTVKGSLNTPANGGYGPFTVLAGLIGSFFILSFLAAGGGKRAKVAVAAGALIDVVLLLKSRTEIGTVAKYVTADPATRVVTTADTTATSQPWGLAGQVAPAGGGVTTLAADSGAQSAAFYGSPFSLGSPPAAPPATGGGTTGTVPASGLGAKIAADAQKLAGDPYTYGGESPVTGFDCSGLVQYVLGELGVTAPRTSEEQYSWATPVSASDLSSGDLVFAQFPGDNSSPGHVGIYVGNGQVLSAEDPSAGVGLSSLASWAGNIVGYGAPPSSSPPVAPVAV